MKINEKWLFLYTNRIRNGHIRILEVRKIPCIVVYPRMRRRTHRLEERFGGERHPRVVFTEAASRQASGLRERLKYQHPDSLLQMERSADIQLSASKSEDRACPYHLYPIPRAVVERPAPPRQYRCASDRPDICLDGGAWHRG